MDGLRPTTWDDYIGQKKLKERLQIHITGAVDRDERLDHTLLVGPPGCGKTSIANLISEELIVDFTSMVMPVKDTILRRAIMENLGVLFLDEIHNMPKPQQEMMLPFLEDGYIMLPSGHKLENPDLCIVGATTEPQKIIPPLYDRFTIKPPWDPYTDDEMGQIVKKMGAAMGVRLSDRKSIKLGRATGGVPRKAKELVKMCRDLGTTELSEVFKTCRVTPDGLTENHVRYLEALTNAGGIAGFEIIAAHLPYPKPVISTLEQLLVKRKMIEYTKGGRQALGPAYKALKTINESGGI